MKNVQITLNLPVVENMSCKLTKNVVEDVALLAGRVIDIKKMLVRHI